MTTLAVKITTQAQANQLASIVHSNNARTIDQDWHWNGVTNVLVYKQKPFKVGNTALFWLYPSNVHYSQYTSACTETTLESILPEQFGTVNDLAQAFQKLG